MVAQLITYRNKIYLFLMFVSGIFFTYSVQQVYPIIVEVDDPLGLASSLTPSYWIGLAILVLTSILAFFDRELRSDAIYILLLFALGLFLVGITVFGYPQARNPNDYYFIGQTSNVLAAHHVDIGSGELITYYSWPAYHFLSASILSITGIDPAFILKYWSLLGLFIHILITYAIGKRLKLTPNYCFLISFMALSSWWAGFFNYSPRSLGMVLFLLIFMLLLTSRKTVAETVIVIFTFAALVITHGFTTLAVFPPLIMLAIYYRESRESQFIALFTVMFGAWYVYQAFSAMEAGIRQFLTYPLAQLLHTAQLERYEVVSATARAVARYSQLGRAALYIPYILASFVLLLKGKITGQQRSQLIPLFCWLVGVALIVFLGYGEELYRAYLFSIVPAAAIIALCFSRPIWLVPLMCILVALFPLANYATECSWGQVLTTELKGAEFVALKLKPMHGETFYYNDFGLMRYYDPNLRVGIFSPKYQIRSPEEVDLSVLDKLNFVIMSKWQRDSFLFAWGVDPYAAWPRTESGQKADLIYNNGYFQIYRNNIVK